MTKTDWAKTHYKKYPWKQTLRIIQQRCHGKNHISYPLYGGKGIKCLITSDELEWLWGRDQAWLMKRPSIDRVDPKENYTKENCRYIELSENSRASVPPSKRPWQAKGVIQKTLDGDFVKRWYSQKEAADALGFQESAIGKCCRGVFNNYRGYKWEFPKQIKQSLGYNNG